MSRHRYVLAREAQGFFLLLLFRPEVHFHYSIGYMFSLDDFFCKLYIKR